MSFTVIGIDLAKNSFSVCALNGRGKIEFSKALTRAKLSEFLNNTPATLVAMEACAGAHYWARLARKVGHAVKMMSPQYVKPFIKSNKSDANDALAIAEAALRETIPSVPIKEEWQQDILAMHRVKERVLANRVALSNEIRGLLLEYGFVIPQGVSNFKIRIAQLLEGCSTLSESMLALLRDLMDEYRDTERRLEDIKAKIAAFAKKDELCRRIQHIPGVGPIGASAIVASVGKGQEFRNGRHMAAWIGLVPRHSGTGGNIRVLGISKRGDRYLRKILIQGAQTLVRWAETKESNGHYKWIRKKLAIKHRNKVVAAVANKNARIIWAMLANQTQYDNKLAFAS